MASFSRSSSKEVRIRVADFFSVVYFSRGTLPKKDKSALLGDLVFEETLNKLLLGSSPQFHLQLVPEKKSNRDFQKTSRRVGIALLPRMGP